MRFLMTSVAIASAMISSGVTFAKDPLILVPKLNLKGHAKAVWCVAYSPDGKILATGGGNLKILENNPGELILWSPATGKRLATLPSQGGRVRALAFSPDGKTLAAGYEPENIVGRGQTVLWNVSTKAILGKNPFASDALAFSSDGKLLAMGGDGPPPPPPQGGRGFSGIEVWDVKQSVKTASMTEANSGGAGCLAFSPDGRTIASGGTDGMAILWDAQTGKLTTKLPVKLGPHPSLAFSPDGLTLAMGTKNEIRPKGIADEVTLLDLKTMTVRLKISLSTKFSDENINSVAFSHNGKTLAVGTGWSDDGEVFLYNPADGKRIAHLRGHADTVKGVAFSADDKTLASGCADSLVLLWDVSPKGLSDADGKVPAEPAPKTKPTAKGLTAKSPESTAAKTPPELPAGKFPESVVKFHKSMVSVRSKEAARLEERIKLLNETVRLGGHDVRSPELRMGRALLNSLNQRLILVKSDKPYIPRISPKDFVLGQIGELDDDIRLSPHKGKEGVADVGVKYEFLGYFTGQPGVWVDGVEVGDSFKVRAAFTANLQPNNGEYNRADPSVRLLRSHVYEVVEGKPRGAITDYTLAPFKMDEVHAWLRGPVETIFKNLNHAEFQQAFDKAVFQQQRPTKLTMSVKNGIVVFSGIFATDYIPNRKWTCRHGLSTAKFEELNAQLAGQGYQLESHAQATHNGQEVHAAVWVTKK